MIEEEAAAVDASMLDVELDVARVSNALAESLLEELLEATLMVGCNEVAGPTRREDEERREEKG
eukprot:760589-Hanusia_phi.AAC.4